MLWGLSQNLRASHVRNPRSGKPRAYAKTRVESTRTAPIFVLRMRTNATDECPSEDYLSTASTSLSDSTHSLPTALALPPLLCPHLRLTLLQPKKKMAASMNEFQENVCAQGPPASAPKHGLCTQVFTVVRLIPHGKVTSYST